MTIMRKWINLFLIAGLAITVSCKSRKPAFQPASPATATTSQDDNAVYDAYRNKLPDTKVEKTDQGIKVTFDSEVLFPTNSSYLSEKAKKSLTTLAAQIKTQGSVKIQVDGHTDKTGTPEYNQWLSDKRSVSVKSYLIGEGIPEGSISNKGYGDTKPVADNASPEGRAKNRRVELTISKG